MSLKESRLHWQSQLLPNIAYVDHLTIRIKNGDMAGKIQDPSSEVRIIAHPLI